jgi:hypothetical protein
MPQCNTNISNRLLRSPILESSIGSQNKNTVALSATHRKRRYAMCFEFEYLYWAKLEEEARQRKEEEEARRRAAQATPKPAKQPEQQPVPV